MSVYEVEIERETKSFDRVMIEVEYDPDTVPYNWYELVRRRYEETTDRIWEDEHINIVGFNKKTP